MPGRRDIKTNSTELYKAFLKWSGEAGTSQKTFNESLQEPGYTNTKGGDGRMHWEGIGLIVYAEEGQDQRNRTEG